MITLDTSVIIASGDKRDQNNARANDLLRIEPGPRFLPSGILAEVGYMAEVRFGPSAVGGFALTLLEPPTVIEHSDTDLRRVAELADRYADLPLGFADACVIACAERNGGRILTFDKHFHIVAAEGKVEIVG